MTQPTVRAIFTDIGGVLLTNGWDRKMRRKACEKYSLDFEEIDERHHLTFDTYEEGKLSLDGYLDRVIFYEPRSFTRQDFKDFMFAQSAPYPEMIQLLRDLRARYNLKIASVSNEGRELTTYRIEKFGLGDFIDFFVSSCFVHFRKPDEDIFRVALDVAQTQPDQVVYIEDRALFVQEAARLGFQALKHNDYPSTRAALEKYGLRL